MPQVPSFGDTITIAHLLHHTSGLRDWPEALAVAGWRWDEVFSFDDIMRMVKAQKELDFRPGSKYAYSNTGYNLLAAIVEKVSGISFREWTHENIFQPLSMHSSQFQDNYGRIIKNLAYAYGKGDQGFVKQPGALTAYGSSSMFTTVEDLGKWVIHFDKQVQIKNPVYLNMLTKGKMNNGKIVPYGYGLETGEDNGLRTISHTGGWAGYRSVISNYPDENLSIIILSNSADFNPSHYARQVANLFLHHKWKKEGVVLDKIKEMPTIQLSPSLAARYVGTYQLSPGWLLTLSWEDGRLMSQATNEAKFPTEAKSDSTIWIDAYNAPVTFVKSKTGKVEMLRYSGINAGKVTPLVVDPKLFGKYTGTYYSEELAAEYKVDFNGGKLMLHHRRAGDFVLLPDGFLEDLFTSDAGSIQFFRDGRQKILSFKLSGSRIMNIRFIKR